MPDEMPIEHGKVREFARAAQSQNPDYDRIGGPIPPTFLITAGNFWSTERPTVASLGFDLTRVLHGEQEYEFFGPPPSSGQTLTFETVLGAQWEKEGKRGGTMRFAQVVTQFRDPSGTVVAEQRSTVIETAKPPTTEEA